MKNNNLKKIIPKSGQESVWDYPRPPRLEKTSKRIKIAFNGEIIADTSDAYRVLETSHPPVYYLPPNDVNLDYLTKSSGSSYCEWKGQAKYYDLKVRDKSVSKVAWYYPNPTSKFLPIKNFIAFYPAPMDSCIVDGEIVQAQPGKFYGGWITSDIVGPFKGSPGTMGW